MALVGPELIARLVGALGVAAPAGWVAARLAGRYSPASGRPATMAMIAACLMMFGWAALAAPDAVVLALTLCLGWALICLAAIDLVALRLPDLLTLPLIVAGLVAAAVLPGMPVLDHLAGAAAGYGLLAVLAWGFRRLRGEDGVGLGDAKLLAAAGAWLGWRALPSVLVIACLAAFAWIAVRALAPRRESPRPIPFGPPLALAIWLVWLHGPLTV